MKSSKPKATDIEKSKRLFTIQGWILDGVADPLIVKQITQQWNLSKRQAFRYIKEAYTDWHKIEGVTLDMKREMKIAELKQAKRSLQEQYKGTPSGIRALMMVEKEIIKLEGIVLPKELKIQNVVKPIEFTIIKNKE